MRSLRSFPVRVRLTASYIGVLAVILLLYIAATSIVFYFQLKTELVRSATQEIETVEGLLSFRDGGLILNQSYHNHPESRKILDWLLEVISPDGTVLYRNERLGDQLLGGKPFDGEGVDGYSPRSVELQNGLHILLVSRRHLINGHSVILRLGYETASLWTRVRDLLAASLTTLPIVLAFAAFLGYQLARRSLQPLDVMAKLAEQITAENLNQRLPIENPEDELGQLARVFNKLLDRLQQSFEQLRRFTSDASHELRTPLAAMRSVGEMGMQNDRTPAQYQQTVGSMLEEVGRLTKLVDNLLAISRADEGRVTVALSEFPAFELASDVVSTIEVLAEDRGQTISITGDAEMKVKGDPFLLRQALMNILDNAVKYSPMGGAIQVSLRRSNNGMALLAVTDSGPGIPVEHRLKVFDRFYRIDTARARGTGGTGLGLAIAQWAVQAQGGRITVSGDGQGATFSIQLPTPD